MNNQQFYVLLAAIISFNIIPGLFHSKEKTDTRPVTEIIPVDKKGSVSEITSNDVHEHISLDEIQSVVEVAISNYLEVSKASNNLIATDSSQHHSELVQNSSTHIDESEIESNYQLSNEILDNIILSGVFTKENNIKLHQSLQNLPEEKYEILLNQFMTAINNNEIDIGNQIPLL